MQRLLICTIEIASLMVGMLECCVNSVISWMTEARGVEFGIRIGSDWPQMGQICYFLRSVFSTFWLCYHTSVMWWSVEASDCFVIAVYVWLCHGILLKICIINYCTLNISIIYRSTIYHLTGKECRLLLLSINNRSQQLCFVESTLRYLIINIQNI